MNIVSLWIRLHILLLNCKEVEKCLLSKISLVSVHLVDGFLLLLNQMLWTSSSYRHFMCRTASPLNFILLSLCAESDLFQDIILKNMLRTLSNLENFRMSWIHAVTVTMKQNCILPWKSNLASKLLAKKLEIKHGIHSSERIFKFL